MPKNIKKKIKNTLFRKKLMNNSERTLRLRSESDSNNHLNKYRVIL